ncbi:UNVERIFIED_CONTAM: phospholipase D-like domain-containing protein [Microbacterium sp. SLM126]
MSGIYDRNTPPDPQPPATAPKAGMPASVPDLGTASARARARVLHWMRRRGSPVPGNHVDLLCNGQAFFPALIEAIDAARVHVVVETYIYADDAIGARVGDALIAAAQRGVDVRLVVDGFGAGDLPAALQARLRDGGVVLEIYRPLRGFKFARRHLRRLHRKIAVIDGKVAFVGGINIIDDHNHGPVDLPEIGPRFDFAVRVRGPLVAQIALASARLWFRIAQRRGLRETASAFAEVETLTRGARQARSDVQPGGVPASLLLRDNLRNRRTIEREYLYALGAARQAAGSAPSALVAAAHDRRARYQFLQQRQRRRAGHPVRVEFALRRILEQRGRVDLAGVDAAHRPPGERALGDLLVVQQHHVVVAGVLADVQVEPRHRLAAALQRLQENAVAVAQHAGHAVARVVGQAGFEDGIQHVGAQGLPGAAGVEQAN